MFPTLFLLPSEKAVFDSFSDALKDGWTVETESKEPQDSAEMMRMRLELMRLHDPFVKQFQKKALAAGSLEDVITMIHNTDLGAVNEESLAELFFALGPVVLTSVIGPMLNSAKTDEDLTAIEALTGIRHSLILSQ